jgi:hypothetical protein
LGEKRLAGFLARHGYCGGKSTAELLARLRSAPEGRTQEAEEEARTTAVVSLVAALKPLVEQIGVLDSRIAEAVRSHPDGEVFLSLFRDPGSTLSAAKLLSEIGDRRERYPSAEALAADAGMCPVAKEKRESARSPLFAEPATNACGTPWRPWPTPATNTIRGQETSTSGRADAGATTRTPSGCWAGRGYG